MAILADLSQAELLEHIAKLERKLAANGGKLTKKVSKNGGVSVYGLGRWPVTLYRSQWERLLADADNIKDFIEANADQLASKDHD